MSPQRKEITLSMSLHLTVNGENEGAEEDLMRAIQLGVNKVLHRRRFKTWLRSWIITPLAREPEYGVDQMYRDIRRATRL